MLSGEVPGTRLLPSDRVVSPLGRTGVPYIYPGISGMTIRVRAAHEAEGTTAGRVVGVGR